MSKTIAPAIMSVEDRSDDEPERKVEVHTDHPKMPQSLPPSPPTAIELFSGSKHLTSALHMCGINAVGFDIIDDTEFDILNPAFYTRVEHYMHSGTRYVHFGPPCRTFSQARYLRVRSHDLINAC